MKEPEAALATIENLEFILGPSAAEILNVLES